MHIPIFKHGVRRVIPPSPYDWKGGLTRIGSYFSFRPYQINEQILERGELFIVVVSDEQPDAIISVPHNAKIQRAGTKPDSCWILNTLDLDPHSSLNIVAWEARKYAAEEKFGFSLVSTRDSVRASNHPGVLLPGLDGGGEPPDRGFLPQNFVAYAAPLPSLLPPGLDEGQAAERPDGDQGADPPG